MKNNFFGRNNRGEEFNDEFILDVKQVYEDDLVFYEVTLEDELSLNEITSILLKYANTDKVIIVTINGHRIYSDDLDLKRNVYLAYYDLSLEDLENYVDLDKERSSLESYKRKLEELKERPELIFYLSVIKDLVNDYDSFLEELTCRENVHKVEYIVYISRILLALEKEDAMITISDIISNPKCNVEYVFKMVKKYGKKGNLLDSMLDYSIVDSRLSIIDDKIDNIGNKQKVISNDELPFARNVLRDGRKRRK